MCQATPFPAAGTSQELIPTELHRVGQSTLSHDAGLGRVTVTLSWLLHSVSGLSGVLRMAGWPQGSSLGGTSTCDTSLDPLRCAPLQQPYLHATSAAPVYSHRLSTCAVLKQALPTWTDPAYQDAEPKLHPHVPRNQRKQGGCLPQGGPQHPELDGTGSRNMATGGPYTSMHVTKPVCAPQHALDLPSQTSPLPTTSCATTHNTAQHAALNSTPTLVRSANHDTWQSAQCTHRQGARQWRHGRPTPAAAAAAASSTCYSWSA